MTGKQLFRFSFNEIFLISGLVCLLACDSKKTSTQKEQSIIEVRELLAGYYEAMSERDWSRYRSYFAPDATLSTVWQEAVDSVPVLHTYSISDFIAQTAEGPDSQPIFEEKMLGTEVSVKNNLAQAWVDYEAKFGSERQLIQWKGVDLFSLMRYHGEWKIVSIAYESK